MPEIQEKNLVLMRPILKKKYLDQMEIFRPNPAIENPMDWFPGCKRLFYTRYKESGREIVAVVLEHEETGQLLTMRVGFWSNKDQGKLLEGIPQVFVD